MEEKHCLRQGKGVLSTLLPGQNSTQKICRGEKVLLEAKSSDPVASVQSNERVERKGYVHLCRLHDMYQSLYYWTQCVEVKVCKMINLILLYVYLYGGRILGLNPRRPHGGFFLMKPEINKTRIDENWEDTLMRLNKYLHAENEEEVFC